MNSTYLMPSGVPVSFWGLHRARLVLITVFFLIAGCDTNSVIVDGTDGDAVPFDNSMLDIDLNNLPNYAGQSVPGFINEDNTQGNNITNIGATLGRVLFYDTNLSVDNTVSCATCHQQQHAFGDPLQGSEGVNGFTQRQSMRLVNARFSEERAFFWDKRAATLEEQTSMPIQDHIEMGFSGENGDPDIDDLCDRLAVLGYYPELFRRAFGDVEVTETRIQFALAQFVRSIQSFDSKYDLGRAQVNNDDASFGNFTAQENLGKSLFMDRADFNNNGSRTGGGLSCERCHRAPEFDIDPDSRNNGVIASEANPGMIDVTITRSPSLRDMFNSAGELNTPLMHTGDFVTIDQVIDHYNDINEAGNNNLDRRLAEGNGVRLNITNEERAALTAFLKTLTGRNLYEDPKWSNPFLNN